jgi:hypothetical protein
MKVSRDLTRAFIVVPGVGEDAKFTTLPADIPSRLAMLQRSVLS